MILEGIVTTRNADGSTNVAPMGPHCHDTDLNRFELRPFQTATTFANLRREGEGILHITDDVLLIAHAALNSLPADIEFVAGDQVNCQYVADACRVYEFTVSHIDTSIDRASAHCQTIHRRRIRDHFGFNRAKHMVIEATILATRLNYLPAGVIEERLANMRLTVSKTGGLREREAFEFLSDYIASQPEEASRD